MDKQENHAEWVDRYVRHELSETEEREFEKILMDSPKLQEELEVALALRESLRLSEAEKTDHGEDPIEYLKGRNNWQPTALAASVLLAVFSTLMYWKTGNEAAGLRAEIESLQQAAGQDGYSKSFDAIMNATKQSAAPLIPAGTLVDMSYPFNQDTIYWPTAPGFSKSTDFEGITDNGFYYTAYSVSTAEHGGTHLDAPIHFAEDRLTADQIPLDRLMGKAVVIDVSQQADQDRDYQVGLADLDAWEAAHGRIPDDSIVLIRTGFGKFWPDREAYLGTGERGANAVAKLHFPGIEPALASFLARERSVKAVGIDTASIDYGQSTHFESHQHLFEANIPAFENVAQLDELPETGAFIIALPMKIEGGSGGPLRIVGVIP